MYWWFTVFKSYSPGLISVITFSSRSWRTLRSDMSSHAATAFDVYAFKNRTPFLFSGSEAEVKIFNLYLGNLWASAYPQCFWGADRTYQTSSTIPVISSFSPSSSGSISNSPVSFCLFNSNCFSASVKRLSSNS